VYCIAVVTDHVFAFSGNPISWQAVSANIGETAHLLCGNDETITTRVDWNYRSSPEVIPYTIISAGHLINGAFGGRLSINETTLIINNVQKYDSGVYTCVEDTPHRPEHHVNFTAKGKFSKCH